MTTKTPDPDMLTHQLAGREVSHVSEDGSSVEIHFIDGVSLSIRAGKDGLVAAVTASQLPAETPTTEPQPTKRQIEYLRFIHKYILRFGRPPAESDIQRHFLVAAPSVNQMIQTLERRGFISRQRGVPRSIVGHFPVADESRSTIYPSRHLTKR